MQRKLQAQPSCFLAIELRAVGIEVVIVFAYLRGAIRDNREITRAEFERRPLSRRFGQAGARLTSPLL